MPVYEEILQYDELVAKLGSYRRHILLGNGFSIACDPIFRYARLYDAAVKAGLSERAQSVFERLGTNNFEGVMRLLDDAHWVARTYSLIVGDASEMLSDVEIVKQTLVDAVAKSHLEHTGKVAESRKDAALEFLRPYHNIFTTNYDLLPYWVNMHADHPPWKDGFRSVEDDRDTPYVVFSERLGNQKGLFYIHGALHLYVSRGELRKHTWIRTGKPLTQLVREGLEANDYPLFVAEGSPEKKLEQIQRTGYLWYCLDKFSRIKGPLVVFGHSLGPSDEHIANAIATNPDLSDVALGIHGDPTSPSSRAIMEAASRIVARREEMKERRPSTNEVAIHLYDSASVSVWG